jgi:hypothetical protein
MTENLNIKSEMRNIDTMFNIQDGISIPVAKYFLLDELIVC